MKKLLVIIGVLALLGGCSKVSDEGLSTIAWYSMTFEMPEMWEVISASETQLEIGHGVGFMTITRGADISSFEEYGKTTIADQNYRFISGSDRDTYTTSWEKKDVLIETNLSVNATQEVLKNLRKPRLEWQGYEFERPGGADWVLEGGGEEVIFVNDDGDFLENEVDSSDEVKFNVLLSEEIFEEEDFIDATYYNEVNFDGAKYRIVRFYDEASASNMVLYAGYLKGGDFVWIGGEEAYDDDMQDILNEIIDL